MTILAGQDLAALLAALKDGPTDTFADVGGQALPLALATLEKWDVAIDLIDLDPRGQFPPAPSGWVAHYLAALRAAGAEMSRVRLVSTAKDLRPADILANLSGFGDRHKVKHLAPVLEAAFHADSRMISDIRKGSGSFPFLRDFGSSELLWHGTVAGQEISRVLFRPNDRLAARPAGANAGGNAGGNAGDWARMAAKLAGEEGFFRQGAEHSFLFVPRGRTLVVTFDNLDIAMDKRADRKPWGYAFIEKQGWSMLGVMAAGWTWYRDPWVSAEFDRLASDGFFQRFERVVFYGASMGAYAAAAFSPACPGAHVLSISPQSTLDKAVVPWETRYKVAWGRDFGGPYGDAAAVSRAAAQVTLLYDPYEPLDRAHAERFTAPNVTHLRTPLLGHRLGSSLAQMGLLPDITLAAIEGTLTPLAYYRALRARHGFARYQRELFQRALDRGRPGLAARVGRWVLARGDNRFIRLGMGQLAAGGMTPPAHT